jgi:transcriptional regulator with XRE-family HTH domain
MIRQGCPVEETQVSAYATHGKRMKIEDVARLLAKKRGSMGLRAAAGEIGISPTTLSRIENGHVPDVATLNKICIWLEEDPSQFTGIGGLQVAFKKKQTAPPRTAQSLARLIELASKQFAKKIDAEGH